MNFPEDQDRLLYFNLMMDYHLPGEAKSRTAIFPIMQNLASDETMAEIYRSFLDHKLRS